MLRPAPAAAPLLVAPLLAALAAGGCVARPSQEGSGPDLRVGLKADGHGERRCLEERVSLEASPTSEAIATRTLEVEAAAFVAGFEPEAGDGGELVRIVARDGAHEVFGLGDAAPTVTADEGGEARRWTLRLENLGRAPVVGKLCVTALEPTVRDPSEPRLEVRFTRPACRALPEQDVPEGVFCEDYDDRERSRRASGVADRMLAWFDDAREAAEAGEDVTLTMAYLSFSDARFYDALCRASAAGVRFAGFFDAQSQGSLPPRLASDPACRTPDGEAPTLRHLGGLTEWGGPDGDRWRLMHIKLVMIEVAGAPTTRLLFGSANVSSSATSVHFENWVFAELPAESHFVRSHLCAREALVAASEASYPADARVFDEARGACIAAIEAPEDPRLRVIFAPDAEQEWIAGGRSSRAMRALIDLMAGAERSVDMAVQHYSALALAHQMRRNARDPDVRVRLVLDDDTFYSAGESPADREVYEGYLEGEDIDIRFLQTNYGRRQLQHNKYVVIDDEIVFAGAGNFTESAFIDNYENFYVLRDPAIAQAYAAHFERLRSLAKRAEALPETPPSASP